MVLTQMPLKLVCIFEYFALLLLLATPGVPAYAVMYKWVDENGVTHYGDSIPSQYINRANVELNQGGVILKKNEPALTPEQIKEFEESMEMNFAQVVPDIGRFRTNLFQQRGHWCLAMRYVKTVVPKFQELGLLEIGRAHV
jgi:hypothetical protein